MTFDSIQISSLRHSSQKFISTANGNTIIVIGEGSLTLIDTLNLDYVLVNDQNIGNGTWIFWIYQKYR